MIPRSRSFLYILSTSPCSLFLSYQDKSEHPPRAAMISRAPPSSEDHSEKTKGRPVNHIRGLMLRRRSTRRGRSRPRTMAAYPVRSAVPLGVSHKRALYDIRGEGHGAPLRAHGAARGPHAAGHCSGACAPRPALQPLDLPAGSRSRVPVRIAPAGPGSAPRYRRRAGSGTKKRVPTQAGTLDGRGATVDWCELAITRTSRKMDPQKHAARRRGDEAGPSTS